MPPPTNIHHYLPPAKLYPPPIKMYPPLPTISQNISTTTHNHPPPPTPSQSISNTTHHHQTWAKIYPPLSTTTHWKSKYIHHHQPQSKIYPSKKVFDCMFSSCHVRISGWIHTLYLPEDQVSPCSKQVQNLKFKWLQWDSNPQPLSS